MKTHILEIENIFYLYEPRAMFTRIFTQTHSQWIDYTRIPGVYKFDFQIETPKGNARQIEHAVEQAIRAKIAERRGAQEVRSNAH